MLRDCEILQAKRMVHYIMLNVHVLQIEAGKLACCSNNSDFVKKILATHCCKAPVHQFLHFRRSEGMFMDLFKTNLLQLQLKSCNRIQSTLMNCTLGKAWNIYVWVGISLIIMCSLHTLWVKPYLTQTIWTPIQYDIYRALKNNVPRKDGTLRN